MGMLTGKHKNRSYLEDYQKNDRGEYEYRGATFRWEQPEKRKEVIHRLWLCLTAAAAAMLAAGCIPAPGVNNTPYLLLPYAAGLGFCVWSGMALSRMTTEADPMREHVFKSSVMRLPVSLLFGIIAGVICVVAEIVYMVLHAGEGSMLFGILFVILEAAAAFLLLTCRRKIGGLTWHREENEEAV